MAKTVVQMFSPSPACEIAKENPWSSQKRHDLSVHNGSRLTWNHTIVVCDRWIWHKLTKDLQDAYVFILS